MTRDEIIKLAREAGFVHSNPHSEVIVRHSNGSWQSIEERLDQFAKLVAAAEREQCALAAWEVVEYEVHADLADQVAQAIRARSQA